MKNLIKKLRILLIHLKSRAIRLYNYCHLECIQKEIIRRSLWCKSFERNSWLFWCALISVTCCLPPKGYYSWKPKCQILWYCWLRGCQKTPKGSRIITIKISSSIYRNIGTLEGCFIVRTTRNRKNDVG